MCANPTNWRWVPKEHSWGLVQQCNLCSYHYPLRLQPGEPDQILAKARRENLIDRNAEGTISQHCNAMYQQVRTRGG
jgi:hypothetical protein